MGKPSRFLPSGHSTSYTKFTPSLPRYSQNSHSFLSSPHIHALTICSVLEPDVDGADSSSSSGVSVNEKSKTSSSKSLSELLYTHQTIMRKGHGNHSRNLHSESVKQKTSSRYWFTAILKPSRTFHHFLCPRDWECSLIRAHFFSLKMVLWLLYHP